MVRVCIGCPLVLKCLIGRVSYFTRTFCPKCQKLTYEIVNLARIPRQQFIYMEYGERLFEHNYEECEKHHGCTNFLCMSCYLLVGEEWTHHAL
jgi:hypothetical protein